MKKNISPARTTAYKILNDVLENKAFSNISVNANLNISLKNEKDRRLAVHIVYGTLKKKNRLEKILAELSNIPTDKINSSVRIILLMSIYQIAYMSKIPEYALVNDAVNMCKFYGNHSAASFVNAILRNALRRKNNLIGKEQDFFDLMYYEYGFPKWILQTLKNHYTEDFLLQYAKASEEAPDVFVRINTLKVQEDILKESLAERSIQVQSTYVPETLKVLSDRNIFSDNAYRNGWFYAQDLSGVVSGYALDPQKDDTIIDLCSAPGGKSFNAGILSYNSDILSCDINTTKLDLVKRSAKQLGLSGIKVVKRDATVINEKEVGKYNRVICDVPCSGLGVIKRKPEILYRLTEEHISNLLILQAKILTTGLNYLKKGGTLLYSTCTLNPDENMGIVDSVIKQNNSIELVPIELPFQLKTQHKEMKSGQLFLDPIQDDCDGFFMAKLTKK